jgi:hypothetical protein
MAAPMNERSGRKTALRRPPIWHQPPNQLACALATALCFAGCASVHQEDLDAWAGWPVSDLEKHPVFLTMKVVRTTASDGTEIRNYVNGRNVAECSSGGTAFTGQVDFARYTNFISCMQRFAACNNIFYIKNGIVERYSPIGTGGAGCYSDASTRPGFAGAANIR